MLAGLTPDQVFQNIRMAIPTGGRQVPDREIRVTVEKAFREKDDTKRFEDWRPYTPAKRPTLDAVGLRSSIMAEGSDSEADLWEASPVRLCGVPEADAVLLLQHFYDPDEFLFLGDTFDKAVMTAGRWVERIRLDGTKKLPHIIPNPVDGAEHETSAGTMSCRCDAAVKAYRFATVEFDDIPRDEQLRFWSGILRRGLLSVACLIDSGGKSVHAWIRVNIPDREVWVREVKQRLFEKWLIPLGVDSSTKNPARLSRLPGHHRAKTGRWQRVLWLQQEKEA